MVAKAITAGACNPLRVVVGTRALLSAAADADWLVDVVAADCVALGDAVAETYCGALTGVGKATLSFTVVWEERIIVVT